MKKIFTLMEFEIYLSQHPVTRIKIQRADQDGGEEVAYYNFDFVFDQIIPMIFTNGICLQNEHGFFRMNMVRGVLVERKQDSCVSKYTVLCGGSATSPATRFVLSAEH